MSRAATVTRIVIDERAKAPGRVGALVKRKFFDDYPPFIFNVCFSCGAAGRRSAGTYCDPHSIWFNVFLGYYEIVAPKSLWSRPFGYDTAGGQAAVRFEDVVRIGKADWNYFSNYLYGVPERLIEPYNRVRMDKVRCLDLGRERIPAAVGGGEAGRYWDVVEVDGVEVVSAYVSGRDGNKLESPSLLSPLWRLSFGRPNPRGDYPDSFIPTVMRARLYLSHGEGRHPRLGGVYRTVIFGGTVNTGYRDAEENERFLERQAEAARQVIGRYYPHLGFASHRRKAPHLTPASHRTAGGLRHEECVGEGRVA
jgi:hypothetical protein